MINVHKRLITAFDTLPLTEDGFKPNYDFGNEVHLNLLIKLHGNNPQKPMYPLIYNVNNGSDLNSRAKIGEFNLSLVLATRNTNTDFTNSQRWATSYKNVLFPLAENIETLFKKGSIFIWSGDYTLTEFPNYGNNAESFATDIVDALRFDTTIKIYNDSVCFRQPIKY